MCSDGHRFESWFRSGDAYDQQAASRSIACPVCGDTTVTKAPMRLFVARHGSRPGDRQRGRDRVAEQAPAGRPSDAPSSSSPLPVAAEQTLRALRKLVEATCDDVGRDFPEQARRIYYGDADSRAIYGEASADEANALREEGIAIQPLPWMRRRDD